MKNILVFFWCVCGSVCVLAQQPTKIPFIISGNVIADGIKKNDDGKFDEALDLYNQVPENDTNYAWALYESAFTNFQKGNKNQTVVNCLKGIQLNEYNTDDFYNLLGRTYSDLEDYKSAISLLNTAVQKFPLNFRIWDALGDAYEKNEQPDSAVFAYQQSVKINPFGSNSHLRLGLICFNHEQTIEAMLSLSMFLVLSPGSDNAGSVIGYLEKVCNGEKPDDNTDNKVIVFHKTGEDNFSEVKQIVESKIALSKKYKGQTKLNYNLVKQVQVMCEQLQYNAQDNGFWMQAYVPFFTGMYKQNYFPAMVYSMLSGVNTKDIQSWFKKNGNEIDSYISQARALIIDNSGKFPAMVNGKLMTGTRHYGDGNYLSGYGDYTDASHNTKTGNWIYLFSNGNVQAEGNYNSNGEKDGQWNFYYEAGGLKETDHYKNNIENGEFIFYYSNGKPSSMLQAKDGKLHGEMKHFYATGNVSDITHYTDGDRNGAGVFYYQTGGIQEKNIYKDDRSNGVDSIWYEDGKLKEVAFYENDLSDSSLTQYFENGKLKMTGHYSNGKTIGTWVYYYESGNKNEEDIYGADGKQISSTEYFENGTTRSIDLYTNGNLTKVTVYDEDGKLHFDAGLRSSGTVDDFKFYDKTGKVISESDAPKNGITTVTAYDANGYKWYQGQYKDGFRDGHWTYYFVNGNIAQEVDYKKGSIYGTLKNYYMAGGLKNETDYKNDVPDGYYRSYTETGTVKEEGWYKNDEQEGVWQSYFANGNLRYASYYIDNSPHGTFNYYYQSGKIESQYIFTEGYLETIKKYDTSGVLIKTCTMPFATGEYKTYHVNGNQEMVGKTDNDHMFGTTKIYHANGVLSSEGNYQFDDKTGEWKTYDFYGKLTIDCNYKNGDRNGKYIYYENGSKFCDGIYKDDSRDSVWTWYFEDGKTDYTVTYKDQQKNGYGYKYNIDGQLMYRLKYVEGVIIAYSYLDANKNYVPEISLPDFTGKIICYYSNGTKSCDISVVKGCYDGKYMIYYPDGKLREEVDYSKNNINGWDKTYNTKGILIEEDQFLNDDLNGRSNFYDDNGNLKRIEQYSFGSETGTWYYYDKNGNLLKTEFYFDGELLN